MKLRTKPQTNHLLLFDNIKSFKPLLKPIPLTDTENLFKILNNRASKLTTIISKGFDDMMNDDFKLNCIINTNCCFSIFSNFGGGCNFGYLILDQTGSNVSADSDLVNEVLSESVFPSMIEMKEIIFKQRVRNFTSEFSFKNESFFK